MKKNDKGVIIREQRGYGRSDICKNMSVAKDEQRFKMIHIVMLYVCYNVLNFDIVVIYQQYQSQNKLLLCYICYLITVTIIFFWFCKALCNFVWKVGTRFKLLLAGTSCGYNVEYSCDT